MKIGLRIDVDTERGLKIGVPKLLNLFADYNVKATFYIITGNDSLIKTIPRIFTESGFAKRIFRIKKSIINQVYFAPKSSIQMIYQRLKDTGHEIGLHGYHHFEWQRSLHKWSPEKTALEINHAVNTYQYLFGQPPKTFAVPGWLTNENVFRIEEKYHFDFCSDTRGFRPFFPLIGRNRNETIQIPVTLPTLDELITLGESGELLDIHVKNGDIYCAHAEFDGMGYLPLFSSFLKGTIDRGFQFVPLSEIKKGLSDIPVCGVEYKTIPGRTSIIAVQRVEDEEKMAIDTKE
jgi:undecaprenyl phosphate-alpha-L-ara4FN deformylase